jgi:hypothetical protein
VRVEVGRTVNRFRPTEALGAGIDRLRSTSVDGAYAPATLQAVLAAGWGPVSYRLNTELHIEAWHWNPDGAWSDPARRGYFTGSATPAAPIRRSYGYPLPRRGFTRNEGEESAGYSRLTDGDFRSIWKSNPYLERPYAPPDLAAFPQWVVVDLGAPRSIDAVRIAWAEPHARRYEVQYWTGADATKQPGTGQWRTFPSGAVTGGRGGTVTVALGAQTVRFLRLLLLESSGTCAEGGPADRRNCVGYAIAELSAGTRSAAGAFHDLVQHSPDQRQTATTCSSVDPWHTPGEVNEHGTQTGFDLFYRSGVTRGLPAMVPVAVLYGTPDDAAAEIRYLEARGYPISYVELGEEPDGQYMTPEHYGALYLQFAAALHHVDPRLKLGGPVFTGVNEDIPAWPDARGNTSWLGRFLAFLRAHDALGELGFMSFEHYPYPPCEDRWEALYDEPRLIAGILDVWRKDGLPPGVPMLVTEVNISWQSSQRFVDVWGGLWLADYLGAFLTAGGAGSYFFHYLPWSLGNECKPPSWGTFALHTTDRDYRRFEPLAQLFASQLLTGGWVVPGDGIHEVHPAATDVMDAAAHRLVTSYALRRPDGSWSLLLVNKDRQEAHTVSVVFDDGGRTRAFAPPVEVITWGAAQYVWRPDGARGHAAPARPPIRSTSPGEGGFRLPPASLTVLHGGLGEIQSPAR